MRRGWLQRQLDAVRRESRRLPSWFQYKRRPCEMCNDTGRVCAAEAGVDGAYTDPWKAVDCPTCGGGR